MNYYYDIELNFNEEEIWEFYEWEKTDSITQIKKIPLFRVNTNTLCDFLEYKVVLNKDFLKMIYKKATAKEEELDYIFVVSDGKNSLALEANSDGYITCLSKLTLHDENNLNEIIFTISKCEIEYEKKEKRKKNYCLRQIEHEKKIISCELRTLFDKKDEKKMQYLYYEFSGIIERDICLIYKEMKNLLNEQFNEKFHKIYNLIKLSYSNV